MIENSINRLDELVQTIPIVLTKMGDKAMSIKPYANKWSKKEIMGHLIDSATNNHQRFVRGQFEEIPTIAYNQEKWNECNYYQEIELQKVILFWTVYNYHLLEIIKRIPKENLHRKIRVGENLFTIEYLIIDYVAHLEHHLKQVIN